MKDTIIKFITEHKKEIHNMGVKRIGIFGSFARGEENEDSDIDFAVKMDDENRAENYFKLLHYLEDGLKRKIDLGIEENIKPSVKEIVEKEIIYV